MLDEMMAREKLNRLNSFQKTAVLIAIVSCPCPTCHALRVMGVIDELQKILKGVEQCQPTSPKSDDLQ